MTPQTLSLEFELLKAEIIALYDSKGMRSSGKFADSLEVKVFGTERGYTAQLLGEAYAQQLETGRRGGKGPPLDAIKKWIEEKGVFTQALKEIKLSSLAFLILRKIKQKGWKRESHGGVELISKVLTEQRIQKIIDEVGAVEAMRVSSEIIGLFNEIQT
jgi:hypothetical protein